MVKHENGPVLLNNDEAAVLSEDILQIVGAVAQLEKMAKVKLTAILPGAARALARLTTLRSVLDG